MSCDSKLVQFHRGYNLEASPCGSKAKAASSSKQIYDRHTAPLKKVEQYISRGYALSIGGKLK